MENEQGSLGQAVRRLRKMRGMSQQDVEDRSGVPKPYVSAVERGAVKSPGFETVVRICQGLGVSVRDLAVEAGIEGAPPEYQPPGLDELDQPATRGDVLRVREDVLEEVRQLRAEVRGLANGR